MQRVGAPIRDYVTDTRSVLEQMHRVISAVADVVLHVAQSGEAAYAAGMLARAPRHMLGVMCALARLSQVSSE